MAASEAPIIIIKRVKKVAHGGGHGGAWKVAYADFVTAMMALFVSWYNYSRPNMALGKKTTPAMAAGLASEAWTIKRMLNEIAEHG